MVALDNKIIPPSKRVTEWWLAAELTLAGPTDVFVKNEIKNDVW